MTRLNKIVLGLAAGVAGLTMIAAGFPPSWDGMVNTPSKKAGALYLLPGADFRPYTKVMIDPVQVAFQKKWMKNFNSSAAFDKRVTPEDADRMLKLASNGFDKIMRDAFVAGGYAVVAAPGPDVLKVSPAVVDLEVTVPDTQAAYATKNWGVDAGAATVVLEARDSMSHAILGRAIDRQRAGDNNPGRRTGVNNAAEFESMFKRWSKTAVDGLAELKTRSPVNAAGAHTK
jgi:hypothetical protein